MLFRAPWQADVRGPAKVAFAALCGLAAWTLLSFLWTPAKEVAIADTERVVAYMLRLRPRRVADAAARA